MASIEDLKAERETSLAATAGGPPARTSNQFFGVGPITDVTLDEADSRLLYAEFERWLEKTYRKLDDKGRDIGGFTAAELGRSMHRGYPADKILLDMMREIHRYFEIPKSNKVAVGLGGGHSGFTVCALHMLNANDAAQHVYVDTPKPETDAAKAGGFFRQSWGTQLIEMHRLAKNGDPERIHFSDDEGTIPSADAMEAMGIKVFIGVGHETTGATTYTEGDIKNLLDWIDRNPENHHAIVDATSMLGAMPWPEDMVRQFIAKCCMFTPFQKAIGGVSGYFIAAFTPQALQLIETNQENPSWAIARQLKVTVPKDPKRPVSGGQTTALGPIYDPEKDQMLGGIINTFSNLSFAETTFRLLRAEKLIGAVSAVNKRSTRNRQCINDWVEAHPLFEPGVSDAERRGAAVTLLKINDPGITDPAIHARILARSKQLLSYEGITHPNGQHENGLDVARYVNAFPGTPGDYRAWIGGIRPESDITALLDNLEYAYHRAKIVVLEEELEKAGQSFPGAADAGQRARQDDPDHAYKVLVADLVGLKFDADGQPDHSAVQAYIEFKGGAFHLGPIDENADLKTGKIHFFYQPDLSTAEELLPQCDQGQYDAVIAAATFLPAASLFKEGGVRIGAGTGNMASGSWGGGNGDGGGAPLMNTPSFNSRATAQMVLKALLKVAPDLPVGELHDRVVARNFDTGKNLKEFPTEKLEGKTMAVLGYGNIGREVAKLAKGLNMNVTIYARPAHKDWIESEGFCFADSPEAAAKGADVISPHTGLGPLDAESGKFANEKILNSAVLDALNPGAVVINYDRGELVDCAALDAALESGQVRYAGIDADLFKDAESGELSGPMVPYLALEERHRGKMELLPHAAADTEHLSRVQGAKQAVDQIFDAIQFKSVTNLKGDLPPGYVNAGATTVNGVGKVTAKALKGAVADGETLGQIRELAAKISAIWGAIGAIEDGDRRQELIDRYSAELIQTSNRYAVLMDDLGLKGPYAGP